MVLFSTIMMCLLALLTLLGGLFLLGYVKKEGLGKFTKLASYLAISFSTIVFIVGLVGLVACPATCGSGHCSKGMKQEKCIIIKKECKSGEKCEMDSKECHMNMGADCKGGKCEDGSECSAEMMKNCPKGEGCNTPEECAAKMKNCDTECMKKCEKEKGACDGKCKK
jgi:hypothetical protein